MLAFFVALLLWLADIFCICYTYSVHAGLAQLLERFLAMEEARS